MYTPHECAFDSAVDDLRRFVSDAEPVHDGGEPPSGSHELFNPHSFKVNELAPVLVADVAVERLPNGEVSSRHAVSVKDSIVKLSLYLARVPTATWAQKVRSAAIKLAEARVLKSGEVFF